MGLLTRSLFFLVLLLLGSSSLADKLIYGDASAGKSKAAVCAACHGADGNSTLSLYPKLAGQGAPYLEKQLHDFQTGARKDAIMTAQAKSLTATDIEDLAAYFSSQQTTSGQADPKLVQQGAAIFRGGIAEKGVPACAACHGPAGQGIPSAAYPKLAGQYAAYIEEELKAFRAAGRNDLDASVQKRTNDSSGDKPGPMQTIAAQLSDLEIKQVASFISGLSR